MYYSKTGTNFHSFINICQCIHHGSAWSCHTIFLTLCSSHLLLVVLWFIDLITCSLHFPSISWASFQGSNPSYCIKIFSFHGEIVIIARNTEINLIQVVVQTSITLVQPSSDLSRDVSYSKEEYVTSSMSTGNLVGSWSPPKSSSKFWNVRSTSGMLKSSKQLTSSQTPRSCIFWDHNCIIQLEKIYMEPNHNEEINTKFHISIKCYIFHTWNKLHFFFPNNALKISSNFVYRTMLIDCILPNFSCEPQLFFNRVC